MTLKTRSTHFLPQVLQKSLLFRGVGLLSVLAVLSGGVARTQEATEPAMEATADPAPILVGPSSVPEVSPSISEGVSSEIPIDPVPDVSASPIELDESYIDSTQYNIGATQRSSDQPRTAVRLPSAPSTVQVGPLTVNSYGLSFGTTPSVKDYYRRTIRPPGRLGNGNIRLIFPLSIPAPITSLFGWRFHPITGEQRFHSGTDIGAPIGTPVLAAYAGRVALADFLEGYGLTVLLEHNKGSQQTLYGHLSELFVKPGEWVPQGVVIGRVGNTGLSTGPHLHFEFHQQTPEGWVALDAGEQLEYALAQLMKTMGVAQLPSASETANTLELDLSATMDVNLQEQS
ncbi:M23 family metallopeptidase [Leptothermofonsia sp. ETS-13]|uniref:M23 family metallopeptidase n=1 Tax=Leptothermofonsia sp. ETS-13 TaxID=3035696 RepID=UPI003B9EF839